MRISDWSSDVCSSDLRPGAGGRLAHEHHGVAHGVVALSRSGVDGRGIDLGSRIPAGKKSRRSEPRPHLLLSGRHDLRLARSEEHTSQLQSLMRISYAVFCLKKKTNTKQTHITM